MRITAGLARGHILKVPHSISDLRPSQDQVRLAIFNILNRAVKNAHVLDLYAGTGSLGIESLSRGACFCEFVDHQKSAISTIHLNLNHSHFLGKAKIYCSDAEKFARSARSSAYDLIFLDPPYAVKPWPLFHLLNRSLKQDGIIVYLHAKSTKIPVLNELKVVETRVYGGTGVTLLTKTSKSSIEGKIGFSRI